MKRKWFILLIIMMSISLVGIIMIQLYWINNAIRLKEAQFNQNVKMSLKEIAEIIEKRENVLIMSDQLKHFERTVVSVNNATDMTYFVDDDNKVMISSGDLAVDLRVDLDYDSMVSTIQAIKGYYQIDTLSNEVFGNYVYTISDGDSVSYLVMTKPGPKRTKVQKLGEIFERMVIEAEDLTKPIEEMYTTASLNDAIEVTLWSNGIDQQFEFAIESDDTINPIPIQSNNFDFENASYSSSISVFPEDIYGQNKYQLYLSFPGKSTHLLKSVSMLLLVSLLLTMILIATFGTTIYMILRQKRISDIKTDFINNMTHEFKTPIATISLAVDSINSPKTLDKKDNILYYTGIIKEENKRMNTQVENVLQMSLLDKHEIEFNLHAQNLHDLIRNAIRKISLQVEERNGKIDVRLDATNALAMVDEEHFTNAILNLLDNANKYSPEAPDILVSTSNSDEGISISIQDHGIGMSKDVQKKIFDKFYRETSGNIHNVKGFGLGLTYVRAILHVIKGKIKIHSEQGIGSTFEMIIPTIDDHE